MSLVKTFQMILIILSNMPQMYHFLQGLSGLAAVRCCDVISPLSNPCSLHDSHFGLYFFFMHQTQFFCTSWPFCLESSSISVHDSHLLNIHDWTQWDFFRKSLFTCLNKISPSVIFWYIFFLFFPLHLVTMSVV